ncbi:hypothetical protein [Niallia sp. NCCP-28]|uniref:hypothetical protein n=1 Tax=Niallia sp. NCCP-28 TaxID=2934712 RepID=UPI0020860990|nr:hypothetical protein [Niallia sp. NCCP-28]GKU82571.1 hypothetical protein NCCP28_19670 [Niallia sp. NCCP-28]
MKKVVLNVKKKPYSETSGLTFYVLEEIIMSVGFPGTDGYKYLEHYENLSYPYKNQSGNEVKLISLDETDYEVFFEIQGDYPIGMLSEIADEITLLNFDYQEQYNQFLEKVKNQLDITKL